MFFVKECDYYKVELWIFSWHTIGGESLLQLSKVVLQLNYRQVHSQSMRNYGQVVSICANYDYWDVNIGKSTVTVNWLKRERIQMLLAAPGLRVSDIWTLLPNERCGPADQQWSRTAISQIPMTATFQVLWLPVSMSKISEISVTAARDPGAVIVNDKYTIR